MLLFLLINVLFGDVLVAVAVAVVFFVRSLLVTKVSKSRAIPPYVPGVTPYPGGWPLISA